MVDADGVTGWQYAKPSDYLAVPYVAADTDPFASSGLLFWPEGEKDTDTVAALGLDAFTFGGTGDGLPAGCEQYVSGRNVVILADNDEPGREHAEKKAALIHGTAASVRIVEFPDVADKGDVSDWVAAGHTAEELTARANTAPEWLPGAESEPANPARKPELPYGFSFGERGLMFSDPDDLDKPAVVVAGHFEIEAETRDSEGASWGVLLRWKDHDDREHRLALPRASLAGDGSEARRMLMDGGFYISPTQKGRGLFNSFLLQVKSPSRARATNRVGWHGNSFVLPDDYFGDERDVLLLQSATAHEHAFRQAGTLESWQENVARYASGNSRLLLSISAAFAGPLIGPCSAEGGGIHLRGASSTGKSTALHAAGSVWGGGEAGGYVRSWRATSNGLEGVALAHSDTFLCLDELAQIQAREAGEVGYMLANGSGKSRSARDGSARRAARWRVLFLSSGEISLADKAAEDGRGKKLAAGQHVRVIDLAADAGAGMGLFENLHGFASADVFAQHLREASGRNYGVAARQYLAALVPEVEFARKAVASVVEAFSERHVPAGADGQVERVAQRFALIAAAGELARQIGILPWQPDEAMQAAAKCFKDWIAARGGHGPAETRAAVDQVRAFLLANGMARFYPAWEEGDARPAPFRDLAGFRQKTAEGWDYFITSDAWKEICAGLDPRRTASVMKQLGLIGGEDGHNAKVMRVPGHGRLRLYHVLSNALEDSHAD